MFELTCPSCRDVRTSPFIRVNAVTRCPACDQVWRISASQISTQKDGVAMPPASPEPSLDEDLPATDPRAGSSVTGLSGLSEIMQAVPAELPTSLTGGSPRVREAKIIKPTVTRAATRPTNTGSAKRRVVLIAAAAVAVVVALAGLCVIMLGDDETPNAGAADPSSGAPLGDDELVGPPAPVTITPGDDGRPTAQP